MEYGLVVRHSDGGLHKIAQFDSQDIDSDVAAWFYEIVDLISMPPPAHIDPTGLTGIGYDPLPHPHTVYCTGNPTPELGEYLYPLDKVMEYVLIDGAPSDFSAAELRRALDALLETHAVDVFDEEGLPRITIELPMRDDA